MPRLALAAALLMLTGTASAYEPSAEVTRACLSDWWRLCAPELREKQLRACFRAHAREVSEGCRRAYSSERRR